MNKFEVEELQKKYESVVKQLDVVDHFIENHLDVPDEPGLTRIGKIGSALDKAKSSKLEIEREYELKYNQAISDGKFPGVDHLTVADGNYLRQRLAEEAEREGLNHAANEVCKVLEFQLRDKSKWDEDILCDLLDVWKNCKKKKAKRPNPSDQRAGEVKP